MEEMVWEEKEKSFCSLSDKTLDIWGTRPGNVCICTLCKAYPPLSFPSQLITVREGSRRAKGTIFSEDIWWPNVHVCHFKINKLLIIHVLCVLWHTHVKLATCVRKREGQGFCPITFFIFPWDKISHWMTSSVFQEVVWPVRCQVLLVSALKC